MVPPNAATSQAAAQAWQTQLEQGLEAGQTPLLELGLSQRLLDDWAAQQALVAFNQTRTDILTPTLLIGGSSALWPAILLQPAELPSELPRDLPSVDRPAPALDLLYGGADQATYMASVTTVAADRLLAGHFRVEALPASLQPIFAPLTNPGVTLPWSALALRLLNPSSPPAAGVTGEPLPTDADPWLVWSALTLVILLVLLALFV